MKLLERELGCGLVQGVISPLGNALQTKGSSPNSDVAGPFIGEMSYWCIRSITIYATSDHKPLDKYKKYASLMIIIGGLGTAFLLATTMGKTWKDWGGNFAFLAGSGVLLDFNDKHGYEWLKPLLLIGLIRCKYALQKQFNPSLILRPYLIHEIALTVLLKANEEICTENLSKDQDAKKIYLCVSTLCLSYLLAKVIQNKMGAKSLKINWKVEALIQGATLATLLLAYSENSPIYED